MLLHPPTSVLHTYKHSTIAGSLLSVCTLTCTCTNTHPNLSHLPLVRLNSHSNALPLTYTHTAGSLTSRPQPHSHARPFKYSHIVYGSLSPTQRCTHPCQMIHPRNSVQHLADRGFVSCYISPVALYRTPARPDGSPTDWDGWCLTPSLHPLCHFILSALLICHSHRPFVTSMDQPCALHMHVCLHMPTQVFP